MAIALDQLDSLPRMTGTSTFFSIMNTSRLGVEDAEVPIQGRPLRTVIRIIFTTITLPFFIIMGAVYNTVVSGSKLFLGCTAIFAKNYFEMRSPCAYFHEGLHRLILVVNDLAIGQFFPLFALTYAIYPSEISGIYSRMNNWLEISLVQSQ